MIGKLGGAAFKLAGLKTDVDAWIGLDVSQVWFNMGASSVVMSGDGSPVGWLDQMPMNREKFEDKEIRKILRDTFEHCCHRNSPQDVFFAMVGGLPASNPN